MNEQLVSKVNLTLNNLREKYNCVEGKKWVTVDKYEKLFTEQNKSNHSGVFYKFWKTRWLEECNFNLYNNVFDSHFKETKDGRKSETFAVEAEREFLKQVKNI